MTLDPELEEMRRLGYRAVDRAVAHLGELGDRRVARRVTSAAMRALVREPLPRTGCGVESSLDRFFDELLPHATLVNHPRFFAYIPGPGSFVGAVGEWIAAVSNTFVGTWLGGAVMAQLEVEVLDWLRQALALPEEFSGVLTSGGSMANLAALAAAVGRPARPGAVVYLSREAHYSVAKAARVLGLASDRVRTLAVDDHQRLSVSAVAEAIARDRAAGLVPRVVCANAGTTSTGAVDPLPELAVLCRAEGLWFHVDAAYGGAVALLPEGRQWLAGLDEADSITLDPHKWLYSPFESGCLLTRQVDALREAFTGDGDYMQDIPRDEVNFFERGPELSRGNRALKLWLLFRSVGIDAIAAAIAEDIRLCRLAHDLLAADPRIEIVTPPAMSVFSFALRAGEAASRALMERILADGYLMLSSSNVAGRHVLRWCVANHRTGEHDIRASVGRVIGLIEP